ncbi:MAG: hypothetical protein B9S32_08850 [Verrucomicrobia bacterium Tous-C9LFEB]|nr:MAG: hypothetical protein B9S32_08850 [Verrucomicrobia bacterium Tous-C9LFEB]
MKFLSHAELEIASLLYHYTRGGIDSAFFYELLEKVAQRSRHSVILREERKGYSIELLPSKSPAVTHLERP